MRAGLSHLPAAHPATRLMGQPGKQVAPMPLRRYGGDNPASHAWANRFPSWPTLANLGSNGEPADDHRHRHRPSPLGTGPLDSAATQRHGVPRHA